MPRIRPVDHQLRLDPRRPLAEHQHPVGQQQRLFHVVGDQQRAVALLLPQAHQFLLHGDAGQGVELAQRFVEDQQARLVDQRPRQRHPLRHATGELARPGPGEGGQADLGQRRIDPLAIPRQAAAGLRAEGDVVPHASPGVERRVLEHHHPRRRRPVHRLAIGQQTAAVGRLQTGDQTQQGRLAATGRPQQRDELPRRHVQVDVLQHRQAFAVDLERMGQSAHFQVQPHSIQLSLHRYHCTVPFCQASRRSRSRNSPLISPEQSSAISSSAAYMLA
ncbi:hypothetical protein D3C78_506640 [compost metagenome]